MAWDDWLQTYRVVLGCSATEEELLAAMSDADPGTRAWAATHRDATQRVWEIAANDLDPMVRLALAEKLARIAKHHRPVPVRVLEVLRHDQDPRVREIADQARYWVVQS